MSESQTPSGWGIQLSKLWMLSGMPFPVDVRELAPVFSKQRFPDPVGLIRPHGIAGIDGMLSRRKTKGDWCISYDESVTSPGRINFTLAHELGHYLLHRTLRERFSCGQGDVLSSSHSSEKQIEREANIFASYLLMPANDFRAFVGRNPVNLELLSACAARYGTSLIAAALKYIELTEDAALLVMSTDGFVCWSVPSRLARLARSYLPPGTPLPAGAEGGVRGGRMVERGIWHPSYEAQEFALSSDQYAMSIFLIRLFDVHHVGHDEEEVRDSSRYMSERFSGRAG
jgi:hypothetical protein